MGQIEQSLVKSTGFFENERQALLYTTLLRLGSLGVEKLHQHTLLHRETIQRELQKMSGRGTIILTKNNRNKKATAISLSTLQERLEEKRENFDQLLKPLLEAEIKNSQRTIAQLYHGNHAYGLLEMKLIKTQPPKTPVHVFSTQPKKFLEAMLESKKLDLFERVRIKKEISIELSCFSELRGEVEYNARNYFYDQPVNLKRKYRYVETELSSPLQVQIFYSTVVMSIFDALPSVHIAIQDEHVVKAMRTYFKILWDLGDPQK